MYRTDQLIKRKRPEQNPIWSLSRVWLQLCIKDRIIFNGIQTIVNDLVCLTSSELLFNLQIFDLIFDHWSATLYSWYKTQINTSSFSTPSGTLALILVIISLWISTFGSRIHTIQFSFSDVDIDGQKQK